MDFKISAKMKTWLTDWLKLERDASPTRYTARMFPFQNRFNFPRQIVHNMCTRILNRVGPKKEVPPIVPYIVRAWTVRKTFGTKEEWYFWTRLYLKIYRKRKEQLIKIKAWCKEFWRTEIEEFETQNEDILDDETFVVAVQQAMDVCGKRTTKVDRSMTINAYHAGDVDMDDEW